MQTKRLILLAIPLLLTSCDVTSSSISQTSSGEQSSESSSSISSEVSSSMETSITYENYFECPKFTIEVGQTLYVDSYVREQKNHEWIVDGDIVSVDKDVITGLKEGTTQIVIKTEGKYQKVDVEVKPKGTFSSAWSFKDLETIGAGKKFICIGDSVSAEGTYSNAGRTYTQLVCLKYDSVFKKNYAIGGTTATYSYVGSNIYKEYGQNDATADGPRVVRKAYEAGELNDVDYAFIAYGHNDHYFQPPISVEGDDVYDVDSLRHAHSFKGSYRYMINKLRQANPNIKIILLNCTYSEYDAEHGNFPANYSYDVGLTYKDYRDAIYEIAIEMDCKYVDPWNYTKSIYDGNDTAKYVYNDSVHLAVLGHKKLAEYIRKH